MAEPIPVAVVDDEEPARLYLRELLAPHTGVRVVAECANGFDAVKAMQDLRPKLIFLDIQMPKLDGFELGNLRRIIHP